jgi:hypothetical protein
MRKPPRSWYLLALILLAVALSSCHDDNMSPAPQMARLEPPIRGSWTFGCIATYRMTTYEDDDDLAPKYGWLAQMDTIDVCETWAGNDYQFAIQTVGTSEALDPIYDMVRDGTYDGGVLTTSQMGTPVDNYQAAASLFDFVSADQSQINASYDDPYYAIRALGGDVQDDGGGGTCLYPPCPELRMASASSANAAVVTQTKFAKHQLKRRGIRALLEDFDEEGKHDDKRRFTRSDKHGRHIVEIDPKTELLVAEGLEAKDLKIIAKHEWRKQGDDYVRAQTIVETTDANGRVLGRSLLQFSRITLDPSITTSALRVAP